MNIQIPEWNEMSPEGKAAMREKFRKRDPKNEGFSHLSDETVANMVYNLDRNSLGLVAVVEAGRNRIMHLSLEVERLTALSEGFKSRWHASREYAESLEKENESLESRIKDLEGMMP